MDREIPRDMPGMIADLYMRIAELERRNANRRRKGTIHEIDEERQLYRVKLEEDPETGEPFLTPWIESKEPAMGGIKAAYGLSVGEQVDVVSENGDLTDATIETSIQSDDNPRPKVKPGEHRLEVGNLKVFVKDDHHEVKVGDTTFVCTGSKVTVKTGSFEIEAAVKIKGDITHTGDMTTSGVHTDSNGHHG